MTTRQLITAVFVILILFTFAGCDNTSDTATKKDNTPELVLLAESGDLAKIDKLLSIGQNPNIYDSCKWTPLMKASLNGHLDIVKLLLLSGAEVDQADSGNYTALLLAASRNHTCLLYTSDAADECPAV